MSKIYCRNCQERLKKTDKGHEQIASNEFVNPAECRATGGPHVPR